MNLLEAVIDHGRYKGKTVAQALAHKEKKLTEITQAVDDIGGAAPHLEKELHEVKTTIRVLRAMYADNYSI